MGIDVGIDMAYMGLALRSQWYLLHDSSVVWHLRAGPLTTRTPRCHDSVKAKQLCVLAVRSIFTGLLTYEISRSAEISNIFRLLSSICQISQSHSSCFPPFFPIFFQSPSDRLGAYTPFPFSKRWWPEPPTMRSGAAQDLVELRRIGRWPGWFIVPWF